MAAGMPPAINPAIHSTPLNRGSANRMSETLPKHNQESYEPYLKQDLKTEQELSVEDFMSLILDREDWTELLNSQEVRDISNDSNLKSLLTDYYSSTTEAHLYHRFVKLANHVLKDENGKRGPLCFCRNDPTAVSGSCAVRKPDGIGTDPDAIFNNPLRGSDESCKDKGPKFCPFHWLEFLCYLEFKKSKDMLPAVPSDPKKLGNTPKPKTAPPSTLHSSSGPDAEQQQESAGGESGIGNNANTSGGKRSRPEPATSDEDEEEVSKKRSRNDQSDLDTKVQCASYALEMMSNGTLRTHVIGLYISYCDIHLQYFDRSIFISSKPISFRRNPRGLIALLLVLQQLDDIKWGCAPKFGGRVVNYIVPEAERRSRSKDFLNTKAFPLNSGSNLTFGEILWRQHCLIGRGTVVVRALLTDATDPARTSAVAVKISSPTVSRRNEKDIVESARSKATGEFAKMLDFLPMVHHWEDIDLGPKSPQRKLSEYYTNGEYESRALRLLAFRELQPIQGLIPAEELCDVFRDIFSCYRWLYEEVKIHHRDISLYNIMYYRDDKGKARGVLNDFDLAIVVGDAPSSKQRTATKPFAAYELLLEEGAPHFYRHDLESLFYVILLLTSRFENGKEVPKPPFQDWFTWDSYQLGKDKGSLLSVIRGCGPHPPRPPYARFERWIEPMRLMFREGIKDVKTRDAETLGGLVTFDKMAEILAIDLFSDDTSAVDATGDPEDPFL